MANGHPVTDRDQAGLAYRASKRGQWRAAGELHEEFRSIVGREPSGLDTLVAEGIECGSESIVPAELFQLRAVV